MWSVAQGDYTGAGLSMAGVVPILGAVADATKLGRNAEKAVDAANSAADRANQIHKAVPTGTQSRTTIAVTDTAEGTRIISSSEMRLRPAQRRLLQPGEVEGIGLGHAEVTGVNAARRMGLNPIGTAASRPICQGCQGFLSEQGVAPLSPLKK